MDEWMLMWKLESKGSLLGSYVKTVVGCFPYRKIASIPLYFLLPPDSVGYISMHEPPGSVTCYCLPAQTTRMEPLSIKGPEFANHCRVLLWRDPWPFSYFALCYWRKRIIGVMLASCAHTWEVLRNPNHSPFCFCFCWHLQMRGLSKFWVNELRPEQVHQARPLACPSLFSLWVKELFSVF